MYFLQCLDASHEVEGVMTRVVSTDITFEGTLLNQDNRSMVQQSKVGITRSAVDGALVLEYEDMFTGKRSKLPRSQCLCLGQIEIPKVRRFPSVLAPQIGCNRCIVVDLCCNCEACSLDAPGVVTPDTAPDISEPT